MSRRHTSIPAAAAGTLLLWGATVATAVNPALGTDRLHETLRFASLAAVFVTLALIGINHINTQGDRVEAAVKAQADRVEAAVKTQADRVGAELDNAVLQAADELHAAFDRTGKILRQDRQAIVAVRTLTAELRAAKIEAGDRN
ncbi:hypothetical protein [Nonomuraea rhizosphaerae]|uniref:hypothetical protein n=1 Tax=Nonomuraea rhizosphaerae TaxID=2665663 RepID=UPI001C5E59A8|nr:hypothetical protein [Nonomuraea rhizosphaerae]